MVHERDTRDRFADLYRDDLTVHPIPFFGDVSCARVLTVGINPSATEFVDGRWPLQIGAGDLADRLTEYFDLPHQPAHPWFARWEDALNVIGLSYRNGVAHTDFSPRPTISMSSLDVVRFTEMVREDIRWFFELLPLCGRLRAVFVAGCVTKKTYASAFLAKMAPAFGFSVSGRVTSVGKARVGLLHLSGHGLSLPIFSCSVSPSARDSALLAVRLKEHQREIRSWLEGPTAGKPA